MIHARAHEYAIGTKSPGGRTGHGRADTKLPCLIAGGTYDPSLSRRRAHDHRSATQTWIVALLYRRVKGVHVQVEHYSKHHFGRLARKPGGRKACGALKAINSNCRFLFPAL